MRFSIALFSCIVFCMLSPLCIVKQTIADEKAPKSSKTQTPAGAQKSAGDRERADAERKEKEANESDALAFVKKHHAELAELLQVLKTMNQSEYETAIRDITKARKRLETLEKRDTAMYAIDLEAWKLQSKIDLVLARAVSNEKNLDTTALKDLVEKRIENQKKRISLELNNLAEREKQLKETLSKLDGKESERVEQQMSALLKKMESKKSKTKRKPE